MITKQELIDIMKEGWQPSGYYSVDFNANMVADKILKKIKKVIAGGANRQESVRLGLEAIDYDEKDNILIHDGDRPLVSNGVINECISSLDEYDACCPYILSKNELPEVSNSGRKIILNSEDVDIQTPQCFKFGLIKDSHLQKRELEVNDDISLVNNNLVRFFEGDPYNFKVTTDNDLQFLKKVLEDVEVH